MIEVGARSETGNLGRVTEHRCERRDRLGAGGNVPGTPGLDQLGTGDVLQGIELCGDQRVSPLANAIAGTAIIVGLAALIGVPIGVGAGMYLAEYGAGRLGFAVRFIADVLNGTPSIVVGIVAWTFIVKPTHRFSALAGSVALAILMIPMLARTTEEMVRLVPNSLREAALALGYARWRTSLKVVARTALAGIVTGCLVGIARIAGETAPLLFTALGNLNFSLSVTQPMQTLSLQIYVYATGPFDDWHRLAWASALVLMGLVLVISLTARWATRQRYGRIR